VQEGRGWVQGERGGRRGQHEIDEKSTVDTDNSSASGAPIMTLATQHFGQSGQQQQQRGDNGLGFIVQVYNDKIQKKQLNQHEKTRQNRCSVPSISKTFENLGKFAYDLTKVKTDFDAFGDYEFLAVLGKGSFGKVILSREKSKDRLVAIKVLNKKDIVKKREVVHTITEMEVLKNLQHPFLVECHSAFQTSSRLCLVLDYVCGGELYFHLFKKRQFTEAQTKFYVTEIVLVIGFLHANDLIYRDLKLENLLLDAQGHIKLTDFGLCKDLKAGNDQHFCSPFERQSHRRNMTFCGTPEYLAPEMLNNSGNFNGGSRNSGARGLIYGKGVDWWALGIIIYEMILGALPFRTKTGDYDHLFHAICYREIKLSHSRLSPDVRLLLDGLLKKDPWMRLGRSSGNGRDYLEICEAKWFADVNWDDVYNKKVAAPFVPAMEGAEDTQHFSTEFLELPTALTPTCSFNDRSPFTDRSNNSKAFANSGDSNQNDPFRGFSFCRE